MHSGQPKPNLEVQMEGAKCVIKPTGNSLEVMAEGVRTGTYLEC